MIILKVCGVYCIVAYAQGSWHSSRNRLHPHRRHSSWNVEVLDPHMVPPIIIQTKIVIIVGMNEFTSF
jgi:hypothetical protein